MNRLEQTYQAALKTLNTEQKKAVETIEGPVMVVAGPGTGKTQILALRIAHILATTDTEASSILAITFTEAGVKAMRARLKYFIGALAYDVHISTFHGLANEIIRQYPERFPRVAYGEPINEVEHITVLENILAEPHFRLVRGHGSLEYYVGPIRSAISTLKQEQVTPESFACKIEEQAAWLEKQPDRYHEKGAHKGKEKVYYRKLAEKIEKNRELLLVYRSYEAWLEKHKRYDYQDMIALVVAALKDDADFKQELQERWLYILADEHQDANHAQDTFLALISDYDSRANVFVVGDEKQAIYRFQGATLGNFERFKARHSGVETITLKTNYRSDATVLETAFCVINDSPLQSLQGQNLQVVGTAPGKVSLIETVSEEAEHLKLAETLKHWHAAGAAWHEMAILYRTNREGISLSDFLQRQGIPCVIESKRDLFNDSFIAACILFLRALTTPTDQALARHLLICPWSTIPITDSWRLLEYAARNRRPLLEVMEALPEDVWLLERESLEAYTTHLKKLIQTAATLPALQAVPQIFDEVGLVKHILEQSQEAAEELNELHTLYEFVANLASTQPRLMLGDTLREIDTLKTYGLSLSHSDRTLDLDAVHLTTAHGAKGLEYDYVCLPNLTYGTWGNRRSMNTFVLPIDTLFPEPSLDLEQEDERRLLFVALTRAKHALHLSYHTQTTSGKELKPSVFLASTPLEAQSEAVDEKALMSALFSRNQLAAEPVFNREWLQKLTFERGFNATMFNNYLECPWKYVLRNLLRLPQAQTIPLLFGNAVHAILEEWYDGDSQQELLDIITSNLNKLPLAEPELARLRVRAEDSLIGFVSNTPPPSPNHKSELAVKGVSFDWGGDEPMFLSGKIDRLDILNEREVRVIDYKTGSPKSRNDILGKTAARGSGDYYRQLQFYRLLLAGYERGIYVMQEGVIEFVEPTKDGVYRREVFTVEDFDWAQFEAELKRVIKGAAKLEYLNQTCSKPECEWCALMERITEAEARRAAPKTEA